MSLPKSWLERRLAISLRSSVVVHFSLTLSSILSSASSRCCFCSSNSFFLFLSASSTSITSAGRYGRGFRFSGPPHHVWQYLLTCSLMVFWYCSCGMQYMSLRKSLASLRKSQGPSGLTGTYLSWLWATSISVILRWSMTFILDLAKLKRCSWLFLKHQIYCNYNLVVQFMQKQWVRSSLIRFQFRQCLTMPLKTYLLRSTLLGALSDTWFFQNLKLPLASSVACETMSTHSWLWGYREFQCFSCGLEWMYSLLAYASSAFMDQISSMSITTHNATVSSPTAQLFQYQTQRYIQNSISNQSATITLWQMINYLNTPF